MGFGILTVLIVTALLRGFLFYADFIYGEISKDKTFVALTWAALIIPLVFRAFITNDVAAAINSEFFPSLLLFLLYASDFIMIYVVNKVMIEPGYKNNIVGFYLIGMMSLNIVKTLFSFIKSGSLHAVFNLILSGDIVLILWLFFVIFVIYLAFVFLKFNKKLSNDMLYSIVTYIMFILMIISIVYLYAYYNGLGDIPARCADEYKMCFIVNAGYVIAAVLMTLTKIERTRGNLTMKQRDNRYINILKYFAIIISATYIINFTSYKVIDIETDLENMLNIVNYMYIVLAMLVSVFGLKNKTIDKFLSLKEFVKDNTKGE